MATLKDLTVLGPMWVSGTVAATTLDGEIDWKYVQNKLSATSSAGTIPADDAVNSATPDTHTGTREGIMLMADVTKLRNLYTEYSTYISSWSSFT